jgi:cytochrome c biogenesis protein CcdA
MNEKDILLDNKKQEYSISFMKIFFSYCVVCSHFYNAETAIIKSSYAQSLFHRMQITAVPVFIIVSFFLTEKHYTEQRYDKFIQRIGRLLIPYWGWAFLYYIGYKVIDFFLGLSQMEQLNPSLSYKDFLLQLAFGSDRNLCPPLWYLFDLIFLTSVFWIINKYWGNYVWYIIPTMGIFALCLQYSGINYHLFGNLVYEIRWTLGRIIEVLPYACIGTIMSHFNMVERMKRHRVFVFVIGIILMIMIADLKIFTVMTEDLDMVGWL